MEDLTKHQLILLTILITFVTSIATGIITFTLLSEAPVEVTQTINRVVEKTIEQVTPVDTGKTEKVITTVVVSEEDRVLDAISKNEKSIVRLKTRGADGTDVFVGLGLVVSDSGLVVSDIKTYNPGFAYSVYFDDGKVYSSKEVLADNENGLVFMSLSFLKNDTGKHTFYPIKLGDSLKLKLGQTVISISGRESNSISIGRVKQLYTGEGKSLISIETDIPISRNIFGSPIMNLSGEVVGLEIPQTEGDINYAYMPITKITKTLPSVLEKLK